jgi:hypothetical protein
MDAGANRRKHFRLPYPPGAGPVFVLGGRALPVVELSERGLRLSVHERVPAVGEELAGTLRFPDGSEVPVAGTVVRAGGTWAAASLSVGVGFDRMVSEQRRILREFPEFLSRTQ